MKTPCRQVLDFKDVRDSYTENPSLNGDKGAELPVIYSPLHLEKRNNLSVM